MSDTRINIRVTKKPGGYNIEVWDGPPGQPNDFATIDAHDLTVGFQMAVPYMRSLVEPDPLAALMASSVPTGGETT